MNNVRHCVRKAWEKYLARIGNITTAFKNWGDFEINDKIFTFLSKFISLAVGKKLQFHFCYRDTKSELFSNKSTSRSFHK